MAKADEKPETPPKPGKWDGCEDLFEGEDDAVVASAKARVLADEVKSRKAKQREEAEAAAKKGKKSGSAWI